jgi:hypothetical protein
VVLDAEQGETEEDAEDEPPRTHYAVDLGRKSSLEKAAFLCPRLSVAGTLSHMTENRPVKARKP